MLGVIALLEMVTNAFARVLDLFLPWFVSPSPDRLKKERTSTPVFKTIK